MRRFHQAKLRKRRSRCRRQRPVQVSPLRRSTRMRLNGQDNTYRRRRLLAAPGRLHRSKPSSQLGRAHICHLPRHLVHAYRQRLSSVMRQEAPALICRHPRRAAPLGPPHRSMRPSRREREARRPHPQWGASPTPRSGRCTHRHQMPRQQIRIRFRSIFLRAISPTGRRLLISSPAGTLLLDRPEASRCDEMMANRAA